MRIRIELWTSAFFKSSYQGEFQVYFSENCKFISLVAPTHLNCPAILYEDLILNGNSDKDLDDGDVDELMASQLEKERNRISLKRQSNILKSLSNPVSPTQSTMERRKSSVISHKRSSRTSTVSRGRSSIIGGKRVSVMDPTMDLDLENNPRLMESRPTKTEPQKPTGRTSRSSKLSKDSVASVVQPYQYTPDSSDQTLVRVARYRHGLFKNSL